MKAVYHMLPFVCITEMIKHIVADYAKRFEGTEHEDDWFFYHDALSLMTAAANIAWMKEKKYLKIWVLPVNGLNKEKDFVRFSGRPVGNSPDFMPWYCSLNNDLKLSCDCHAIFTNNLPDTDPKHSLCPPQSKVRSVVCAYSIQIVVVSSASPALFKMFGGYL